MKFEPLESSARPDPGHATRGGRPRSPSAPGYCGGHLPRRAAALWFTVSMRETYTVSIESPLDVALFLKGKRFARPSPTTCVPSYPILEDDAYLTQVVFSSANLPACHFDERSKEKSPSVVPASRYGRFLASLEMTKARTEGHTTQLELSRGIIDPSEPCNKAIDLVRKRRPALGKDSA